MKNTIKEVVDLTGQTEEYIKGLIDSCNPQATNKGTEGGVKYVDTITIPAADNDINEDCRIGITWETTPEYDQWREDCRLITCIASAHDGHEYLLSQATIDAPTIDAIADELLCDADDAAETVRAIIIRNEGDPRDNDYYLSNESNHCDWDNYEIEII